MSFKELIEEIELTFGDSLLLSTLENEQVIATDMPDLMPYQGQLRDFTYLQKLQLLKGRLSAKGYRLVPRQRLADDITVFACVPIPLFE